MATEETYSQIQAAGTGTLVRTIRVRLLQDDETWVETEMQVNILAGPDGVLYGESNPMHVRSNRMEGLLEGLLAEIKELHETMRMMNDTSGE